MPDKKRPQVYDKTQAEGVFFRLPATIRHYLSLPKYKAEMNYLYALITDYYNNNYGYAFPSINTLALYYGKTEKTTGEHLKVLIEVGLLKRDRAINGYRYKPLTPLTEDKFFAEFPQARKEYEKALKKSEAEKERSKRNLKEWKAKQQPTRGDENHDKEKTYGI